MRFKKMFVFSFVCSAVVGLAVAFSTSRQAVKTLKAVSTYRTPDFTGETEVSDDLTVSITAASTTGYSTAYDIKFSTGGDAFYDQNNMINVLGNDDSLMDFYNNEFKPLSTEEKTKWRQDVAAGLKNTLYFEGYVHSFKTNNSDVIVPRSISRGTYGSDAVFAVELTSIASNAFQSNARAVNLYIPKEIVNIPSDAFTLAPDLAHIYCEHESAPVGFEDGWNANADVAWGQDIYAGPRASYERATTIATNEVGDPNINFMLGYYPEENAHPLTLQYDVEKNGSFYETRYLEFEKVSRLYDYDGVGKGIASYSALLTFVIEHDKDETVNHESVKIHNIILANATMIDEKQVWQPDLNNIYFSTAHKVYDMEYDLKDFIQVKFKRVTTFNGYTSINTRVDVVNNGLIYKTLKPKFYEEHEKAIKAGTAKIRFRFTGLTNARYHVFYGNSDKHISVSSPIPQYILSGYNNNNFTVTLKDSDIYKGFNPNNITAFSLNNVSISIDIVKNNVILTKTVSTISFGAIYLLRNESLHRFNLNTFFLVFSIAYLVGAAGVSAFLFFYFKNKYKNDEFRRLKPKQFIKKAIIYALTSLVVALAVLFVVMRLSLFKNAVVVYNPLDVFIVINGIATIIIIGYYVKNLVSFVKANKQRKRTIKLGMQDEEADDGTK